MQKADTKIGLLQHVGGGNLGDDATLEAVVANIKRRQPNAGIIAFSMNPDDTKGRHGIISYPIRRKGWSIGYGPARTGGTRKDFIKALARRYMGIFYSLKAASAVARLPNEMFGECLFLASSRNLIKRLDILIISGGGQLTEKDGPWGFPYTIFKWVLLAKSAGVRCIFLNLGAGPLTRPLAKLLTRWALWAADYVSLRDEESRALVREIGFTGESPVCPDSVYSLEVDAADGSEPEKHSQPVVGFAPMPYPDAGPHGYGPEEAKIVYDAFIRKLANFASWLVGQRYALSLFGTDIGVDPLAIKDLQAALMRYNGIPSSQYRVNQSVKSTRELLASMSGMDYVVTCRFHGVVFAHLVNKPVLAVAHHPKVSDLMAELELSSYCVDIRDFDENLLIERFASMVANAEEIRDRMAASLARKKSELKRQFDALFPS